MPLGVVLMSEACFCSFIIEEGRQISASRCDAHVKKINTGECAECVRVAMLKSLQACSRHSGVLVRNAPGGECAHAFRC